MIATFANGHSIEADFLIGADGIHSRVRDQFLNDGAPSRSRLHRLAWNFSDNSQRHPTAQPPSSFTDAENDSVLVQSG